MDDHLDPHRILSLLECNATDPRTMLARQNKIVDRYLEAAGRDASSHAWGTDGTVGRDVGSVVV
jgi:hypothetical protein